MNMFLKEFKHISCLTYQWQMNHSRRTIVCIRVATVLVLPWNVLILALETIPSGESRLGVNKDEWYMDMVTKEFTYIPSNILMVDESFTEECCLQICCIRPCSTLKCPNFSQGKDTLTGESSHKQWRAMHEYGHQGVQTYPACHINGRWIIQGGLSFTYLLQHSLFRPEIS